MTAEVARLPVAKLDALAKQLRAVPGLEAVFLDVSNKPPSTIEWE
jgi:GMP synthase PP-ATPase subunit